MGVQSGPAGAPGRQRPAKPAPKRAREHDAWVVRSMVFAVIAGLVAIIILAALSAVTRTGTAATVGITAVAAIVSAATGVGIAYLKRRR